MQNEPNSPGALQKWARAAKAAPAGAPVSKRAKQSQFRCNARTSKYLVERELWRIEPAIDLRRIKANFVETDTDRGPAAGLGAGPIVRNKANAPRLGHTKLRRDRLYKQTQSGVSSREQGCRYGRTKPICSAALWSVYKQTQSAAAQVVSAGQFCGTKPIPPVGRAVPKAKCARQSQTWASWSIWGGADTHGEPIVRNKANSLRGHGRPSPRACSEHSEWARSLDAATRWTSAGADCAKRTQSRSEASAANKANSVRGSKESSACRKTNYGGLVMQRPRRNKANSRRCRRRNKPNSCHGADPEIGVPGRELPFVLDSRARRGYPAVLVWGWVR